MTIVDTSVLLDVLVSGSAHGDASARRLAAALGSGPVVVNDVIAAELAPLFTEERDLWSTLARAQVRHVAFPRQAVHLAGHALLRYRRAGGKRDRILPDFLIAAHATAVGGTLLTRDDGFYRRHFPKLRLAA
ncbi:MAG: type II toxin-antitoxin system VapC family toxin [Candidatus Binatia bacterium]